MSDTLRELDEAIQAHIAAAFEGALVDSWILVTHSQSIDQHTTSNYRIVTPDVQPIHVDAGLMKMGDLIIKDSWEDAFEDDDA